MTFWEFLDRRAERRAKLEHERMKHDGEKQIGTPNIRDAIGIVLIFSFISMLFMLVYKSIPPSNEQLIVYMLGQLSGFVSAVVALHYVSKAGEADERKLAAKRVDNTSKALDAIKAASEGAGSASSSEPQDVTIVNESDQPVPTKEKKDG